MGYGRAKHGIDYGLRVPFRRSVSFASSPRWQVSELHDSGVTNPGNRVDLHKRSVTA